MSAPPVLSRTSAERTLTALELGFALLCLFGPLLLIMLYDDSTTPRSATHVGGVAVGMGVILRATARRVLGTAARSILRTGFATFSRASSRTVMRRAVRFSLRMLFACIARDRPLASQPTSPESAERRSVVGPVLLGAAGLALSFGGVLALLPQATRAAITGDTPAPLVALTAGLPLLFYAPLVSVLARRFAVSLRFNTAFDGLLLQAYFTGGGSFLPLTTDVEYEGAAAARRWVAMLSLAGLMLAHLGLWAAAVATGSTLLEVSAAMFLVYAFVYSFPIRPLDGYQVWSTGKRYWLLAWLPALLVFIAHFPDVLSSAL